MDELIRQLQEKGLISVKRIKLFGKAKYVFEWISMMAYSKPLAEEQDKEWLELNLWTRKN